MIADVSYAGEQKLSIAAVRDRSSGGNQTWEQDASCNVPVTEKTQWA